MNLDDHLVLERAQEMNFELLVAIEGKDLAPEIGFNFAPAHATLLLTDAQC
ncbi:hypothetical protein KKG19_00340 [Patescibacteria group bacterium]|nr:hypothetical protein [Patescibacteria group bacterium]